MATTYEYNYEYEVTDNNRRHRTNQTGNYSQRAYNPTAPPSIRTNPIDPLANLQNDRIWHKLYDPLDIEKATHEAEIQVCSS